MYDLSMLIDLIITIRKNKPALIGLAESAKEEFSNLKIVELQEMQQLIEKEINNPSDQTAVSLAELMYVKEAIIELLSTKIKEL